MQTAIKALIWTLVTSALAPQAGALTLTCNDIKSAYGNKLGVHAGPALARAESIFKKELGDSCSKDYTPKGELATVKALANVLTPQTAKFNSAPLVVAKGCCSGACANNLNDPMTKASKDKLNLAKARVTPPAADAKATDKPKAVNESFTATAEQSKYTLEVNQSVIGACLVKAKACEYQAKSLSERLKTCTDPDCPDLVTRLNTLASDCAKLTPDQAIAKADATQNTVDDSVAGDDKTKSALDEAAPAAAPSGLGGLPMGLAAAALGGLAQGLNQPPEEPTYQPQDNRGADCESYPDLASCPINPGGSWNKSDQPGPMASADLSGGGFNPPNIPSDLLDPPPIGPQGTLNNPSSAAIVPSSSTPMAASGGAPSAGGAASPSAAGSLPGLGSKISMESFRSGGYSAANAGMSTAPSSGGGFSGYGRGEVPAGTDLSQFLPGGAKDPTRKAAGMADVNIRRQVSNAEVNIWNRISDHYRMRCSQGLLRDCTP